MMSLFFFFNDTATTEIYTLSLHDALPISGPSHLRPLRDEEPYQQAAHNHRHPLRYRRRPRGAHLRGSRRRQRGLDRKSTRLNSSHANISYAVFCLKKTKTYTHDGT